MKQSLKRQAFEGETDSRCFARLLREQLEVGTTAKATGGKTERISFTLLKGDREKLQRYPGGDAQVARSLLAARIERAKTSEFQSVDEVYEWLLLLQRQDDPLIQGGQILAQDFKDAITMHCSEAKAGEFIPQLVERGILEPIVWVDKNAYKDSLGYSRNALQSRPTQVLTPGVECMSFILKENKPCLSV